MTRQEALVSMKDEGAFLHREAVQFHWFNRGYENFDDYNEETPVDYPDWSVPYTFEIVQDNTTVIYNGVPVGKYREGVIEAFYQSLDSVLKQK